MSTLASNVINSALSRLQQESLDLHNETAEVNKAIVTLNNRLASIAQRQIDIRVEHQIFSTYTGRGEIHGSSSGRVDTMRIDDMLKKIMDDFGKPVKIGDIIEALEKYEIRWSSYTSAYNRLLNMGLLEKVPQTHGYYQIHR